LLRKGIVIILLSYSIHASLLQPSTRALRPIADSHDLTALRELNPDLSGGVLFADKAYADEETKRVFAARGTHLITPYKRKRNESATAAPVLWSRFDSSVRQPLESLFGW
jgi:hypothetical protein